MGKKRSEQMEGHSISGESRKNGWVEQKKELTKVLKIAWPAVFESFFISLAGMIDVYMVSGLGSEAVASVGLTTQPKFLGLSLFFAMNVAIAAIVARRTGEKDKRRANPSYDSLRRGHHGCLCESGRMADGKVWIRTGYP